MKQLFEAIILIASYAIIAFILFPPFSISHLIYNTIRIISFGIINSIIHKIKEYLYEAINLMISEEFTDKKYFIFILCFLFHISAIMYATSILLELETSVISSCFNILENIMISILAISLINLIINITTKLSNQEINLNKIAITAMQFIVDITDPIFDFSIIKAAQNPIQQDFYVQPNNNL